MRNSRAPTMCMRITASASSGRWARSAETSSRWQNSDCARCSSERQNAVRNARGMPATAPIAAVVRGLAAASQTMRWNSSLEAMWASTSPRVTAPRPSASSHRARQPRERRLADPRRGERGGVRLDAGAQVVEVEQVGGVEGGDDRAAVGLEPDERLAGQEHQRLADRGARGAVALGEPGRRQALTRGEVTVEDLRPQLVAEPQRRGEGGHLGGHVHTLAPASRHDKPAEADSACNQASSTRPRRASASWISARETVSGGSMRMVLGPVALTTRASPASALAHERGRRPGDLGGDHEAAPADLVHAGELAQPLGQQLAHLQHVVEEAGRLDEVEHGVRGGARDGAAGERGAVVARGEDLGVGRARRSGRRWAARRRAPWPPS